MTTILLIITMAVLLSASAFFSGSETALFSINTTTLQTWREKGTPSQRLVARLMDDHHTTITTILLGNCFVNILNAIVFTELLARFLPTNQMLIAGVLLNTTLLLACGEVTPKSLAYMVSSRLAPRVAPIIRLLSRILRPLVLLLKKISSLVLHALGDSHKSNAISVDEYQTFTRMAHRLGVFNEAEVEMFDRVFSLREIHVGRFMIPRPDICAVDVAMTPAEVMAAIRRYCHRYLPAIDRELDQVKGVLDVTRFALLTEKQQEHWTEQCLVPAVFVPENGKTQAVLAQLRQTGTSIAFVVNEYGGIEGLITLENIYEQIVGELADEFDQPAWYVTELSPRHWRLSGLIPIDQLVEHFPIVIGETAADTLAGLLAERLEHLPAEQEAWASGPFRFVVHRVHRNRVLEVDVFRNPEPWEEER